MKAPVVFLDRDGTINKEVGYLNDPSLLELLPGAANGIQALKQAGFKVVIITNQSGLARGYFSLTTLEEIHRELLRQLALHGAYIDGIYFCPHHPDEGCPCRKPATALVEKAVIELGLDISRAYVVGDKRIDLLLAKNIGAKGVLVLTGYGHSELALLVKQKIIFPDIIAADLQEAAELILADYEDSSS